MGWLRRLGNLGRRDGLNDEIAAEFEAHIEMRIEANIAAGMTREQARREALLRFGNRTATRERVAAADASLSLEDLGRDLRFTLRQLRRSPGFAITAIVTLALGIGANVAVFGVLNALVLRPLDVPGAERLYEVIQRSDGDAQSYPDYVDLRTRNTAFSDLAAYRLADVGFSMGGKAQRCWDYEISGNFFSMLGVQPEIGRLIQPSDERGPNSAPYIVLSDSFWRARFNADPGIVGKMVELNKHPFTIIGVAQKSFHGVELFFWPDFWVPMINEEQIEGYSFLVKRQNHGMYILGMVKPGVTPVQATNNLNTIAGQLAKEYPAEDDGFALRLVRPGFMGDMVGTPARAFLAAVMALALLVLAAASVNLAGIFAARAADRARELAIRLSIGSTRGRILRQVLTEALVVSIMGGIAGTAVAAGMLRLLGNWQPMAAYPIRVAASADASVYAIAFLLSLASGILPGLLPARQIWRTDSARALKGGAMALGTLRRLTIRDILLCVQIALCAVLVTASLVSLRGMQRSLHAPMGFQPEGAVLAETDMHMAGYSDKSAFPVQQRILENARRVPGVIAIGTISDAPLSGASSETPIYREGTTDVRPSNSTFAAFYFSVSPGYLAAAETKLLAGRDFTWADTADKPNVALVNAAFAHQLFGNQPALGRRFVTHDKSSYEIVGVVEDGKYESLSENQSPAVFYPLPQDAEGDTTFVVRSRLSTAETQAAMNSIISQADSDLPVNLETWMDSLALILFPARVATAALSVMGLLAAMLAVTGIFGMAAYSVSKRFRELGIRVALGAQRSQVVRSALARPFVLLVLGSVAGVGLGVLASRLLSALVYQASPRDPLVLIGTIAAMMLIGLIATWIPARRALGVNPAQLLREE
jgi:predicted permease